MERLRLESLVEKFQKFQKFNIILIEEDLAERFIKDTQISDELKRTIATSIYGYCFNVEGDEYFFWSHNPSKNEFKIFHKKGKEKSYLHDKISTNEGFIKF